MRGGSSQQWAVWWSREGDEFGVPDQPGWIFGHRPVAAGCTILNHHCVAEEISRVLPVTRAKAQQQGPAEDKVQPKGVVEASGVAAGSRGVREQGLAGVRVGVDMLLGRDMDLLRVLETRDTGSTGTVSAVAAAALAPQGFRSKLAQLGGQQQARAGMGTSLGVRVEILLPRDDDILEELMSREAVARGALEQGIFRVKRGVGIGGRKGRGVGLQRQ